MSREVGKRFSIFGIGIAFLLSLSLLPSLVCSAAEQPRRGGTIVVPVNADLTTLNPAVTIDINVHRVMWEVFEGLVEVDRDLNPLPSLAESWEISPDGLTVTFHLAKNVKWHDGIYSCSQWRSSDWIIPLLHHKQYQDHSFCQCRSLFESRGGQAV